MDGRLIPILVKAVQELSTKVTASKKHKISQFELDISKIVNLDGIDWSTNTVGKPGQNREVDDISGTGFN